MRCESAQFEHQASTQGKPHGIGLVDLQPVEDINQPFGIGTAGMQRTGRGTFASLTNDIQSIDSERRRQRAELRFPEQGIAAQALNQQNRGASSGPQAMTWVSP